MRRSTQSFLKGFGRYGGSIAHSEEEVESSGPTILEAADLELQNEIRKIRTPPAFEDFAQLSGQGAVHTFDGMRLSVQKQVNLNSVVSHFFWLGSQAVGQPIYQYSLILVDDDKMLKVSTDMDFNVEVDGKHPLSKDGRLTGKLSAAISDQQGKKLDLEAAYLGDNWTGSLMFGRPMNSVGLSYVQAITPSLTFGGMCQFDPVSNSLSKEFCGIYDDGENTVAGVSTVKQHKLSYRRIINPNRVVLTTDLAFDEAMNSAMTLSAQYMLKQSMINFGVDSNFLFKSMVNSELSPGVTLQFSAEVQHANEHYRFGYGLNMGS